MPTNLCEGTLVENSIGSFLPQDIRNQAQGHCALTARPENLDLTGLTFFVLQMEDYKSCFDITIKS